MHVITIIIALVVAGGVGVVVVEKEEEEGMYVTYRLSLAMLSNCRGRALRCRPGASGLLRASRALSLSQPYRSKEIVPFRSHMIVVSCEEEEEVDLKN